MKSKTYQSFLIAIVFLITANLNFAQQWTQRNNMPTARYQTASCELDGKIYVIGGSASLYSSMKIIEVYDPVSDTWDNTKTDMPTARVELCVAVVTGKIYAIGGATSHNGSPLGMVEVYDPNTDTWDDTKESMPTPRKGAAVGVINNKIYVAGGSAYSNFSPSDKLEIYDPVTDNWTSGTNMLTALYELEGAVVNDKFYVIGGLIGYPWIGQTTVQKYDPVTDIWSTVTGLDTGRVGHTASVVDGKIYVIGGDRQAPRLKSVVEYNPNTNAWSYIDDAPSYMIAHIASVLSDSLIYVFGGSTTSIPNFTPTSAVYSFQSSIVPVPVELTSFTALANGKEVTLKWTTATELNNQGFEIQRKVSSNEFVAVGFVKGHGTTSEKQNYCYIDKNLNNGKYCYRLKQVDYNGSYEYSNVVEVEWRAFNSYLLEQNYPNPFNPTTTIGFGVQEKSDVKIIILNSIGEEVAVVLNENKSPGFYQVEFNATNLPSGIYFYQLKAGKYVGIKKMILLK